jgi:hypothetical protein
MIESFLFRVEPFDPMTLGIVAGTILTLALLVSVRPALQSPAWTDATSSRPPLAPSP